MFYRIKIMTLESAKIELDERSSDKIIPLFDPIIEIKYLNIKRKTLFILSKIKVIDVKKSWLRLDINKGNKKAEERNTSKKK